MTKKKYRLPFVPALLLAVTLTAAVCFLCYRGDNRYTYPRPQAGEGLIQLDMAWYDQNPLFYLVDGWEFYQDKLLSPEEAASHTPDAHFYLGRYGGFDLGDPAADPHGQGTYRLVLQTDGTPRTYAIELTEVYSAWRLWVNGALLQSVGMDDENAPTPENGMAVFTAAGDIEIVCAVRDDSGFYSGMVTPPALGSPERVGEMLDQRLIAHVSACAAAFAIGLLCALGALRDRLSRPAWALAFLCLCFGLTTVWPVFASLGLRAAFWSMAERLTYYLMFCALLWMQGRTCPLPRRITWPAYGVGAAMCVLTLVQPLLPVRTALPLYVISEFLTAYKWFVALWLVATSAWALARGLRYSRAQMVGACILATAMVMDRLLPVHEPVVFGWFPEMAGGALVLIAAGIVWYDTVRLYRESAALRARQELAEVRLAACAAQDKLQREYVRATRERLHESRSRLTLIRHYLDAGALGRLSAYLDELAPSIGTAGAGDYTGHGLIDAILSIELSRAHEAGVYTELDAEPLPEALPISDDDLTALLMNMLDNAVEACARLPEDGEKWLALSILREGDDLSFICRNASPPPGRGPTAKPDKLAHGFGLRRIRAVAVKYGGMAAIEQDEESFSLTVKINFC